MKHKTPTPAAAPTTAVAMGTAIIVARSPTPAIVSPDAATVKTSSMAPIILTHLWYFPHRAALFSRSQVISRCISVILLRRYSCALYQLRLLVPRVLFRRLSSLLITRYNFKIVSSDVIDIAERVSFEEANI